MSAHPQQRAGIITGLVAYALWGLLTIYWKQLNGFRAMELIGWRVSSAALVMGVIVTARRQWPRILSVWRDRAMLARVSVAAVLLTVNWTSYVWAVVQGRVLETALGYFIAPIGTVAIGVIVLKEKLHPAQVASLVLAVASVVVLTVSYGDAPWLAIIIAVSWMVYGYIKKQVPLSPVESMASESLLLMPFAVILAVALQSDPTSVTNSASSWQFALVLLSGIATITPLLLFAHSAQRVPLTVIGPMQYIVPSMNFLIGWLMYDEALPGSRLVGFALVWLGLVLLTVDSLGRARRRRA
ncbi:MAG: hypothetical protein RLZ04_2030 [Actinomycetota bacterium]|jgi:chloramphenicol-sensitive protein RarD